jgi:hypothetical protein
MRSRNCQTCYWGSWDTHPALAEDACNNCHGYGWTDPRTDPVADLTAQHKALTARLVEEGVIRRLSA